jgi:hypothetical protein
MVWINNYQMNNSNQIQHVYVVNPQAGGGGGGGAVSIISSIPLDVNILNPCISVCEPVDVNILNPCISVCEPVDVNILNTPSVTLPLSSVLAHSQISVGTAATLIIAVNASRKGLIIRNNSTRNVFLGGIGVTIASGYNLEPGAEFQLTDLVTTAAIYGIVSLSTAIVSYLEW